MEDYRLLNNDVGDIVVTVIAERLPHCLKKHKSDIHVPKVGVSKIDVFSDF